MGSDLDELADSLCQMATAVAAEMGAPGHTPDPAAVKAWLESKLTKAESRRLAEAGVTKRITDKLGRARCYQDGKAVPCHSLGDEHSLAHSRNAARQVLDDPSRATPEQLADLAHHLKSMTAKELKTLQAAYGQKHSKRIKPERVQALLEYAKGKKAAKEPKAELAPAGVSTDTPQNSAVTASPSPLSLSDPKALADAAQEAAKSLPAWNGTARDPGYVGGHKVYLSDVYEKLKPQLGDATLDDFKNAMVKANISNHLDLTRADLSQEGDRAKDAASAAYHPAMRGQGQPNYHLLAVPPDKAGAPPEPVAEPASTDTPDAHKATLLDAGMAPGEWYPRDVIADRLDNTPGNGKRDGVEGLRRMSQLVDAGHAEMRKVAGGKAEFRLKGEASKGSLLPDAAKVGMAPIAVKRAEDYLATLGPPPLPPAAGLTRLYRGHPDGEPAHPEAFWTDDRGLAGVAVPFAKDPGRSLYYVDVPNAVAEKGLLGGAVTDGEYQIPTEWSGKMKKWGATSSANPAPAPAHAPGGPPAKEPQSAQSPNNPSTSVDSTSKVSDTTSVGTQPADPKPGGGKMDVATTTPVIPTPEGDRVKRFTEVSVGKDDTESREKLKAMGFKYSPNSRTWYKQGYTHHTELPGLVTYHVAGVAKKGVGVGDAAWKEKHAADDEADAYAKEHAVPLSRVHGTHDVRPTDATDGRYAGTPLVDSRWTIRAKGGAK